MSDPEPEPKVKRHYIPVLPTPGRQTLQNAKAGNLRHQRSKRLGIKLDQLLGKVEDE